MKFSYAWLSAFFFVGALVWAENAPKAAPPAWSSFVPILLIFGIFYFLVIRPQQKKTRDHQRFLQDVKRGDMIVTGFGMIGTIKALSDKFVTLEIDEDVCVKILKSQIADSASSLKDEKVKPTGSTQPVPSVPESKR